jgi:hypothetical protein
MNFIETKSVRFGLEKKEGTVVQARQARASTPRLENDAQYDKGGEGNNKEVPEE